MLLLEHVPQAVPFELGFHLEFLVKNSVWSVRGYWFDLCVDLFVASFPDYDDHLTVFDVNIGLTDVKVYRHFFLIHLLIHIFS